MLMNSQQPPQFHQQQPLHQFCVDSPAFEPSSFLPQHQQQHAGIIVDSGGGGGVAQQLQQQQQQQAVQPLFSTSNGGGGNNNNTLMRSAAQFQQQQHSSLCFSTGPQQQQQPNAGNGGGKQQQHQMAAQQPQQQQTQMQQPGAWYFPPAISDQPQGQQQQCGGGMLDPLDPANSPGLMAPQQLLARFGPRHCTESVEVPSSEHVAEIVGRQGCKIKSLRAKTNTYIKTPVRGEEPIFVVTGRHEDVAEARREIECAAEHFTQIRASRRHSQGGCPAPGHVTAYVRVPLRVVGLVVGPKGNTIKRIQQDTHTYIITPSREREPIFEVTGLPQNVAAARREIENHIYQRTGNMPITDQNASIADYNLHAAAIQAQQQSALNSSHQQNGGQRPNYGALAAVSARNLISTNGGGTGGGGISPSPYQQQQQQQNGGSHPQQQMPFYHPQQQQHHQNGTTTNGLHYGGGGIGSGGDFFHHNSAAAFPPLGSAGGGKFAGFGGSERGGPSPTPIGHPMGGIQQQPMMATSTNNLHLLLNALELDGQLKGGGGQQQQFVAPQLLRSELNGRNGQLQQQMAHSRLIGGGGNPANGSAFSAWSNSAMGLGATGGRPTMTNGGGGGVDFLDLITSASISPTSPLLFSSSTGCQSSFSAGSVAGLMMMGTTGGNGTSSSVGSSSGPGTGTGGSAAGGLSSVNSSSRDEGLGDSPTNSFGRPHGTADPYQHLMTIWADLVDQPPPPSPSSAHQQPPATGDEEEEETPQKQQKAPSSSYEPPNPPPAAADVQAQQQPQQQPLVVEQLAG